MESEKHPFIDYLESLREDRGALAALRRGLGQQPGTVPGMYPYVVRWIPEQSSRQYEAALYLVASLFAYHPEAGGTGTMGTHFAAARAQESDNTAIERRFTQLLDAHPEDLPFYLRQAISYLRSKNVPVNWDQLFKDLQWWGSSTHRVQQTWAKDFWGRPVNPKENNQQTE